MNFIKKIFLLIVFSATQSYAQEKDPNDYIGYVEHSWSNQTFDFISCSMGKEGGAPLDCINQGPLSWDNMGDAYIVPRRQYASAYIISNPRAYFFYQCKIESDNTLGDCTLQKLPKKFTQHFSTRFGFLPDLSSTQNDSAGYVFNFDPDTQHSQLLMCPEYPSVGSNTPSLHLDQCVESGMKTVPDSQFIGPPAINPAGTFLYYGDDDGLTQCSIDPKTHLLSSCKRLSVNLMRDLQRPIQIHFDPTGSYSYISTMGLILKCDVNKIDGGMANCRVNTPIDLSTDGKYMAFNAARTHVYIYEDQDIIEAYHYKDTIMSCAFNKTNGTFSQCVNY